MKKEEVIKAAYGEHWKTVKSFVDENGWTELQEEDFGYSALSDEIEHFDFEHSNKWRPISLSGIENNNGWIKIEMESDMPKQRGTDDIYIIDELGEVQVASSKLLNDRQIFNYWKATITHYQPINKPKPPLF
jgi:hypothetical protein